MYGALLQTDWYLGKKNNLILGLDMWEREYDGFRIQRTIVNGVPREVGDLPVPKSKYQSLGFFAQDELKVVDDKLDFTIGGRIDRIKVKNEEAKNPVYIINNGVMNSNPPKNQLASFAAGEKEEVSWSANLGSIYRLTSNMDVTFNVAHSFRAPVQEERFQFISLGGNIYLGNPELKSEKGYFFDLGTRYYSKKLFFKGNAFINLFSDLVVDQPFSGDTIYRKENVGKAQLYGFDFQVDYNFIDGFVGYFNAAYVRGEDKSKSTNLPSIPPMNGKFGIRFNNLSYGSIDVQLVLFSKQDKVASGEKEAPGYGVVNTYLSSAPVSLGLINLRLFAGVENIFDKEYRSHLSTNRGLIIIEPGRNLFVRLNMMF